MLQQVLERWLVDQTALHTPLGGGTRAVPATGTCWNQATHSSVACSASSRVRVFATLEFALLMQNAWPTRAEARGAIFRCIEVWYNRKRRHAPLGYFSPKAYEAPWREAA
ncbi:MAG: IS3 family transposase [Gemmatimonadaceae bacterium]